MLFRGKRGQQEAPDLILTIAELLMVLMAVTIIFGFIKYWSNDLTFEKRYIAKDSALLINSIYASPSKVYVPYYYDTHNFQIKFGESMDMRKKGTQDVVSKKIVHSMVKEKNDEKKNYEWYQFGKVKNNVFAKDWLKLHEGIKINKSGKKLGISEHFQENVLLLDCPSIDTDRIVGNVLFDPGHSENEGYFDGNHYYEGNIVGKILESIEISSPNFIFESTRKPDNKKVRLDDKDIQKLVDTGHSVIIGLHVGSYKSKTNIIRAYYSIESNDIIKKKSKKLACFILNEFAKFDKIDIDGTSIVPIYEGDYENALLPKDKVAILLEIGNINSINGYDMYDKSLSGPIIIGINDYFEGNYVYGTTSGTVVT